MIKQSFNTYATVIKYSSKVTNNQSSGNHEVYMKPPSTKTIQQSSSSRQSLMNHSSNAQLSCSCAH
eukprot:7484524-Lingulodinium_polyedra.AAC.1